MEEPARSARLRVRNVGQFVLTVTLSHILNHPSRALNCRVKHPRRQTQKHLMNHCGASAHGSLQPRLPSSFPCKRSCSTCLAVVCRYSAWASSSCSSFLLSRMSLASTQVRISVRHFLLRAALLSWHASHSSLILHPVIPAHQHLRLHLLSLLSAPHSLTANSLSVFAPFAPSAAPAHSLSTLAPQKVVYILCNLLTLALGLWKCRSMGLLPTGTGDWLAFETRNPVSSLRSAFHSADP